MTRLSGPPVGWESRRRRWAAGHAVRFGLHMLGFGLLVGLAVFHDAWLPG